MDKALAGRPRRRRSATGGRRRTVVAGIAAALVIPGVWLAVWVSAGTEPAPAPRSAAPVAAFRPSPPVLADVSRRELIYQAAMDGTPKGFVVSPRTEPPSAREDIRYVPGALELEAYLGGADTYSEPDLNTGVRTYIGEMDLSIRSGSRVELCWSLRWAVPRQLSNYLCADTERESAVFSERQLSLYVDGQLALDVLNDSVPVNGTSPGIELERTTGTGLVRIEGLRLYELGPAT